MLEREYINSFNNNYLKVRIDNHSNDKLRYQYQIIINKNLEGLLKVSLHSFNGELGLYYEISSMQSITKWFMKEKVNQKWMENLMDALQVALWSLEEYLMDSRNLVLHPDCIFQDMESDKIRFLYLPYLVEEKEPDMESFLSFLVENADEKEPDTIEALYDIYSMKETMQEEFDIKTFLNLWKKHKKNNSMSDVLEEVKNEEIKVQLDNKKEPMRKVNSGRDIAELLLGKYRHPKTEEQKTCMAMESWEYKGEKQANKEEEHNGKTIYAEVDPQERENKLYGNGKQNRKVINLEMLPIVIGKKKGLADVVLTDATISRMHARITKEGEQMYLEDLNATNGTYKNGVRLKPYERVEILIEDEIKLGKLEFTYR